MKILELANIWRFKENNDNTSEDDYLFGATIVFGEEDVFEERYAAIVPLEEFGLTEEQEQALDVKDGHLHAKKHLLDLEKLKPLALHIVCEDIYPDYDPTLHTEFDESSCDEEFFKKNSRLVMFHEDDTLKYEDMKENISVELKAVETLKHSRHPNVAAYLGCLVEHNRVTGLYYESIPYSIHEVSKPLKVEKYIADIRNGIEHIHSVGLCHNDIHTENIRIREDDTAVIIDFDACLPPGEKLHKWAPGRFARDSTETVRLSEPENDWFALDVLEQWMHEQNERERSRTKRA